MRNDECMSRMLNGNIVSMMIGWLERTVLPCTGQQMGAHVHWLTQPVITASLHPSLSLQTDKGKRSASSAPSFSASLLPTASSASSLPSSASSTSASYFPFLRGHGVQI
ncbi:hypothetical protein RIF29_21552 [Crotalaria pallida]|uniref:Uncharacterized protein n=1 Tax=Crotalaria pallida TaxID=3830 RepID=A0AAN9F7J4_CROPI